MITRMIRMVPSDIGVLPGGRRNAIIGRTARREKHIGPPGSMSEPGGPPSLLEYLFRLELQRRRVDAVAQACRPGAVGEDMAEMAAAFGAKHLGADHAVAGIVLLVDMALD